MGWFWFAGLYLCGQGKYEQAIACLLDGHQLSKRLEDKAFKPRILNTLGWVYGELYNTESAIRYNQEGLEAARKVGEPEIIRNAEINLGDNYMMLDDLQQAQYLLEKVYRDSQQRGKWGEEWMKWRYLQHCCHSLGELRLMQGDAEGALSLAEECLQLAEPTQSRKNIVKGWRLKGQVFLAQGKIAEADEALNKALTVAKEIGNPPQLWKTYAALGELHERKGEAEQAYAAYANALHVIDDVAGGLQNEELKRTFLAARQVQAIRERAQAGDELERRY